MEYLFKIILGGDGGIGKSTLLQRLVNHDYTPQELTVGLNSEVFEIRIKNNTIKLIIYDLGGQKQFRTIHDLYCKGAKGIILAYDLSRKNTFLNLYSWNQFIDNHLIRENGNIPKILIGTKLDLGNLIPNQMIEDFMKENHIIYNFFTSAKNNINILSTFKALANLMREEFIHDQ